MNIFYYLSKLIKKMHIPSIKNSIINKNAKVCSSSNIVQSTLNSYSYVGNNCTVIHTEIGKYSSIADNCIIGGASHPIDWVSTSPVFHSGKNVLKKNFSNHTFDPYKKTIICNDVWIGNNCLIKSGVKINTGAIVGMGSVVTKDIGPYEIWAGNPARCIRKRFLTDEINKLSMIQWWDMEEEKVSKLATSFNNLEDFLKNYSKEINN